MTRTLPDPSGQIVRWGTPEIFMESMVVPPGDSCHPAGVTGGTGTLHAGARCCRRRPRPRRHEMTLSSPVGPSTPSVLMRAAAWITFLRSEASPPLMTDSTRLTDCGGPRPAIDPRPASAGLSRPGSLFVTKDEWRPVNLVWLVYSGFFFIEPLQRNTRTVWLTFAGAYACFLAIYLLLMAVRPGTNRAVLLLALAVLGAAYYPFNSGAGGMLIYVAAFAPFMTESLLLAGTLIGAAALITAIEGV